MKNFLLYTLAIVFLIPYFSIYILSNILKLEGAENMPNIKEWFGFTEEEEE